MVVRLPAQTKMENGGDLLVSLMDDLGVTAAFGLVSVHNLPLVDAVSYAHRFVPVRHEAAAVNAADAFSRATAKLGIAITSTGTGAGNAAGALVEALSAGSAILHITGQVPSGHMAIDKGFIHQTKDQAGMLKAVSKAVITIEDPHSAAVALAQAAEIALTAPCGPVSVEWPIDLQYAVPSRGVDPVTVPATTRHIDGDLDRAVVLLQAAERPLIWAGGEPARLVQNCWRYWNEPARDY